MLNHPPEEGDSVLLSHLLHGIGLILLTVLLLNGAFRQGPHRAWTMLGKHYITSKTVFLDAWIHKE